MDIYPSRPNLAFPICTKYFISSRFSLVVSLHSCSKRDTRDSSHAHTPTVAPQASRSYHFEAQHTKGGDHALFTSPHPEHWKIFDIFSSLPTSCTDSHNAYLSHRKGRFTLFRTFFRISHRSRESDINLSPKRDVKS